MNLKTVLDFFTTISFFSHFSWNFNFLICSHYWALSDCIWFDPIIVLSYCKVTLVGWYLCPSVQAGLNIIFCYCLTHLSFNLVGLLFMLCYWLSLLCFRSAFSSAIGWLIHPTIWQDFPFSLAIGWLICPSDQQGTPPFFSLSIFFTFVLCHHQFF